MSRRLQGADFCQYRREHKLTLVDIRVSKSGNYRANMKDERGRKVHHWLNSMEAERLEQSGYLKEHPAKDSDSVFKK